jgi:hypothetical protein
MKLQGLPCLLLLLGFFNVTHACSLVATIATLQGHVTTKLLKSQSTTQGSRKWSLLCLTIREIYQDHTSFSPSISTYLPLWKQKNWMDLSCTKLSPTKSKSVCGGSLLLLQNKEAYHFSSTFAFPTTHSYSFCNGFIYQPHSQDCLQNPLKMRDASYLKKLWELQKGEV